MSQVGNGIFAASGLAQFKASLDQQEANRPASFEYYLPKKIKKSLRAESETRLQRYGAPLPHGKTDPFLPKKLSEVVKDYEAEISSGGAKRTFESLSRESFEKHFRIERPPGPPPSVQRAAKLRHDIRVILDELYNHIWEGWGNPFREEITPENCRAIGIPKYFDFVEKSMSLDVCRRKLEGNEYRDFASFEADLHLMVQNSLIFNREGEDVYKMALEMREKFTKLISEQSSKSKKRKKAT